MDAREQAMSTLRAAEKMIAGIDWDGLTGAQSAALQDICDKLSAMVEAIETRPTASGGRYGRA